MKKIIILSLVLVAIAAGLLLYVDYFAPKKTPTNWSDDTNNPWLRNTFVEMFAVKYNKTTAQIKVTITMQTDNHARGSVVFLDQAGQPGAGANFLAAKINNQWQLVFDGNGQIDCALSSYGFPSEMLTDCAK